MAAKKKVSKDEVKDVIKKTTDKTVELVAEKVAPVAVAVTEKAAKAVKETKKAVEETVSTVEKKSSKPAVFVQYQGVEIGIDSILDSAKKAFIAEGHKASEFKNVKLYIKPEDKAAYYVVDESCAGKVEL